MKKIFVLSAVILMSACEKPVISGSNMGSVDAVKVDTAKVDSTVIVVDTTKK